MRHAEVVATTSIDLADNVAMDILTAVQVDAEDSQKLEELGLTGMANSMLILNSEEDGYRDKGSMDNCVLIRHGIPFELEHSEDVDLVWWTNLIEQTWVNDCGFSS